MVVKDNVPRYFNDLVVAVKKKYETVTYTQLKNNSPASFPHLYFHQLASFDVLPTLSNTHEGMDLNIEVQAYHNSGISEARKFADFIKRVMTDTTYGMDFECTHYSQVENASDSKVIYFVLRFHKTETEREQ